MFGYDGNMNERHQTRLIRANTTFAQGSENYQIKTYLFMNYSGTKSPSYFIT